MNLRNAPWRAYQKYQLDGFEELFQSSVDTLLVNVIGYRLIYQRLLQERLPRLSREEMRNEGECKTYEPCTGEVPVKGSEGIPREDSPPKTYWPGDRFVCTLPDAKVLSPVGPAVASDGRIIDETVAMPRKADRRVGIAVAKSLVGSGPSQTCAVMSGKEEPDAYFDTVALMLPPWNNYYHWTIECLPRIRLLEKYAADHDEYPDLLIPFDHPSWMDETIEQIDYDGQIVSWDGDVAQINKLVICSFPDPTTEECRWLRNRMRRNGSFDKQNRIFVSRRDASVRQIENIEEITPILKEFGFRQYLLSDLSVSEQVHLFANAEIVVAPHGAGLTNIIYADEISVVELFGEKKIASYGRLSTLLDHEYTPFQCRQKGVDLIVDPNSFEDMIREIIEE